MQSQTSTPAVIQKPKAAPFNFGTSGNPTGAGTFDVASKTMAKPQIVSQGTMSQLMGTKAAVPGGVNSNVNNTLPAAQKAPVSQQKVAGSTSDLLAANQQNAQKAAQAFNNAPAGTPVQQPQTPSTPTAPGLLGTVAGFAKGDPELSNLKNRMDQLDRDYADKVSNIYNTPSDLNYQTGRLAAIQSEYNSSKAALNANYQSLLQARGQNIGAAESALGTATTLTSSPYGQPLVNPATGQTISGGQNIGQSGTPGTTGAGVQPSDPFYGTLQQYAQLAATGQTASIPSSITSNPVLNAQMLQMAKQINPNFNPTLAASSAQTQAQGQQLQTQTATANAALDSLGQSFNALSGLQTGGIPLTNSIAQWIGRELGDAALSKYQSNLADARAQLVGVLNASGGTPTGNEATAMQYLPDNMTPAMFNQNVGTPQNPGIVRQLMQQKVQEFTTSGAQAGTGATNQPAQGTGGLYDF